MFEQRDPEASMDRSEINACIDMIGFNGMDKDDEHEERNILNSIAWCRRSHWNRYNLEVKDGIEQMRTMIRT
jgi:hypothetical protein